MEPFRGGSWVDSLLDIRMLFIVAAFVAFVCRAFVSLFVLLELLR
jgi:hypothetical protein